MKKDVVGEEGPESKYCSITLNNTCFRDRLVGNGLRGPIKGPAIQFCETIAISGVPADTLHAENGVHPWFQCCLETVPATESILR